MIYRESTVWPTDRLTYRTFDLPTTWPTDHLTYWPFDLPIFEHFAECRFPELWFIITNQMNNCHVRVGMTRVSEKLYKIATTFSYRPKCPEFICEGPKFLGPILTRLGPAKVFLKKIFFVSKEAKRADHGWPLRAIYIYIIYTRAGGVAASNIFTRISYDFNQNSSEITKPNQT